MKALRNLSYDLADAPDSEAALEGIYRSESWVAAAVTGKSAKLLRRSFLPILMTNKGARVIPGIDLVAGEDRTRRFLNEASFGRLKVVAGEEKMEELKALFGKFEKKAKTN
jgi:hypothetical protein